MAAEFDTDVAVQFLPRMSKFILVAAFLASTNPPKSDLRMFGRGVDDRRKRKKGGGTRKSAGKSGLAKVQSFESMLFIIRLTLQFSVS